MINYKIIAAALVLLGFGVLMSCSTDSQGGSEGAGNESDFNLENQSSLSVEEKILEVSLRASSSHNSQPWVLIPRDAGVYRLLKVEERSLPVVDPEERELLLSLGAYIEMADKAASAYGYTMEFVLSKNVGQNREIGEISFRRGSGNEDTESLDQLTRAYTEKGKYRRRSIDSERMETLFRLSGVSGRAFYVSRNSRLFNSLLEGSVEANRQQAANDAAQRELSGFFCYSQEDENRGIGMTPQMVRLPGFMSRSWYRKASPEMVMGRSFRAGTAAKVRSQIRNSAGFILLVSTSDSPKDLLQCGRLYQRLLIAGRVQGIEMHPISQMLEEVPWKSEMGELTGLADPVQFIIRTGERVESAGPEEIDAFASASIRMSLSDLLNRG